MAFEKTGLNYAKEYSQALAQAYPYVLYFGALWNAVKPDVKFLRNDTVILPSLSVKGRKNGDRDSIGTFGRNFNNEEEPKKIWCWISNKRPCSRANSLIPTLICQRS